MLRDDDDDDDDEQFSKVLLPVLLLSQALITINVIHDFMFKILQLLIREDSHLKYF